MVKNEMDTGVKSRTWGAALLALALLGPAIAWFCLPLFDACFIRSVAGQPCPGCGLGTAFTALVALDFGRAMVAYPPLLPLALGYVLAVAALVQRLRGESLTRWSRAATVCGVTICVAVLGNWIANVGFSA